MGHLGRDVPFGRLRGARWPRHSSLCGACHTASSFLASAPLAASELCGLIQSILNIKRCNFIGRRSPFTRQALIMRRIVKHISLCSQGLIASVILAVACTTGPVQPVFAQSDEANAVSDQDKGVHYSLYYEDFKNRNYLSALPNLQWILQNAPDYPRNDDRNYRAGRGTLHGTGRSLAERRGQTGTSRFSVCMVRSIHRKRMREGDIEFDEAQWLLRKGRFLQEHSQSLSSEAPTFASVYNEVYTMIGCNIDAYYVRIIIDDAARNGDKQRAVNLTDEAEACYPDNADVAAYLTEIRNALFSTPEERLEFLQTRLEDTPDNLEVAAELFDIYLELGYRDEAAELGDRLLEMDPSPLTYRRLGQLHLQDGNASRALSYYEQALSLLGDDADPTVRRDILYNLGIAQQQDGAVSQARSFFRQAIQVDANFGQAYIAIGDLYAVAVSNCGSFEREDRAVYWLAVDYYQQARAKDSSVSAQANQKIATYRRSFPDQEALFFKNWEPGQSYRVDYGCYAWINETTTVRAP